MIIQTGRPTEKREEVEEKVYDFLDQLNVPFNRVDHKPAYSMALCENIEKILKAPIYKNLFLSNTQGTKFYLLVTLGNKKFKTKEISKQLGVARLSFGKEEKMIEYLSCTPGSASILGILFDKTQQVQLLIDEDIMNNDYFGCHPCQNTSTLSISTEDLFKKIIPYSQHEYIKVKVNEMS